MNDFSELGYLRVRLKELEQQVYNLAKRVQAVEEPKVKVLKSGGMPAKRVSKEPGDRE
jgi:hypothetical protein